MSSNRVRARVRSPGAKRVHKHRNALRAAGLRPIQIWVPDVRSKNRWRSPRALRSRTT